MQVEYDYMTEVDSSAIDAVYYSNKTRQLYVEFPSGTIAGYRDVGPDAVYALVGADSVGSHYARHIRGQYSGINTGDLTLVKQRTAVPAGVQQQAQNSIASVSSYSGREKNTYEVTFTTVVTVRVPADTIAQAIIKAEQGNPNAVVTGVKQV